MTRLLYVLVMMVGLALVYSSADLARRTMRDKGAGEIEGPSAGTARTRQLLFEGFGAAVVVLGVLGLLYGSGST